MFYEHSYTIHCLCVHSTFFDSLKMSKGKQHRLSKANDNENKDCFGVILEIEYSNHAAIMQRRQ